MIYLQKNPTHRRHWISWPLRIAALIFFPRWHCQRCWKHFFCVLKPKLIFSMFSGTIYASMDLVNRWRRHVHLNMCDLSTSTGIVIEIDFFSIGCCVLFGSVKRSTTTACNLQYGAMCLLNGFSCYMSLNLL